jgi:hypothetical protein
MKKIGLLFLYALLICSALRSTSTGPIEDPMMIISIAVASAGLLLIFRFWRRQQ